MDLERETLFVQGQLEGMREVQAHPEDLLAGSWRLRLIYVLVACWPEVDRMPNLGELNRWLHRELPELVPNPNDKELLEKVAGVIGLHLAAPRSAAKKYRLMRRVAGGIPASKFVHDNPMNGFRGFQDRQGKPSFPSNTKLVWTRRELKRATGLAYRTIQQLEYDGYLDRVESPISLVLYSHASVLRTFGVRIIDGLSERDGDV